MLPPTKKHSCQITLRPNDFDWSRFLNNAVYPQLFEQARWAWALANDLNLQHERLAAVVVRMEIDYVQPVLWAPHVEVAVDTELAAAGTYSIELSQTVRVDDSVKARGQLRLALYDFVAQRVLRVDSTVFASH